MDRSRKASEAKWLAAHGPVDMERHGKQLLAIIRQVQAANMMTLSEFRRILGSHPRASEHDSRTTFSKHELVRAYRFLCKEGHLEFDRQVLRRIQMKPTRTASGVAPVTVLTKPYPCPGRCVFCPTDDRMPKSYLSDEPGAMRAAYNEFDPYRQTASRIRALENIGHTTDKIELLILGGTWSFYPGDYQSWFVHRCLDAMNGREASSLDQAQRWNETAEHRNVGLVVETRPDWVSPAEIQRLRRLGVTKVQIGAQSLDTNILEANQRGHSVDDTRKALRLLRLAGFKIALHWMPNLLGATPESDRTDFSRLWDDKGLRPDEIKIYPCALLAGTPLHRAWCNGAFQPYDQDTLVQLIADCKSVIPPYCRVNRITRDIPAPHIVAGNKKANLRQMAQQNMTKDGRYCRCIRCREVRRERIDFRQLRWSMLIYSTDVTTEYFFSAITTTNRLAGFLRLSLPKRGERARLALSDNQASAFDEITNCAMIRQVHVYGPALPVGSNSRGDAQHLGVGRQLIENAYNVARGEGYEGLAVISAVGTRDYYRRLGFELADTYMMMEL